MNSSPDVLVLGWIAVVVMIGLIVLFGSWFTVEQQEVAIIQRLGKFLQIARAGLNFKIPLIDQVVANVNLRAGNRLTRCIFHKQPNRIHSSLRGLRFEDLNGDRLGCSGRPRRSPGRSAHAGKRSLQTAFRIDDEIGAGDNFLARLQAFLNAHFVSRFCTRLHFSRLDVVFLKKDEVAQAVKGSLGAQMSEYGYDILTALVTDIDPDERVKAAMNEINANQRLLEAAKAKGEAEKVLKVKQADAEAESKALQGNGIARERTEIARGLHDSAAMFQQGLPGATVQEAMVVLLLTQYFDMLKEVGGRSNTIMLPHSPGGLSDIAGQIRNAIVAAREVPIDHNSGPATPVDGAVMFGSAPSRNSA